jgi:prepilin-type N-terminal cleavage/methylation domain-containing protein
VTRAFTLLELLVVIGIIAILVASVVVAGSAMIDAAKTRSTRAVLVIVRDAVEQFAEEQRGNATLTRSRAYRARYGFYPPDEFEVFTEDGVPHATPPTGTLAVGKAEVQPAPGAGYPEMVFHRGVLPADQEYEHRDMAAMILAIEMFSDTASEMLGHISSSHRSTGPLDPVSGLPLQYLNRNDDTTFESMVDGQIQYVVDAWGIPISYFSQIDYLAGAGAPDRSSSNHLAGWNATSTGMIKLNGNQPIICSYGPDGREQLSKDIVEQEDSKALLVTDWADDGRINDPLNDDNIYPDPSLNEILSRGIR